MWFIRLTPNQQCLARIKCPRRLREFQGFKVSKNEKKNRIKKIYSNKLFPSILSQRFNPSFYPYQDYKYNKWKYII